MVSPLYHIYPFTLKFHTYAKQYFAFHIEHLHWHHGICSWIHNYEYLRILWNAVGASVIKDLIKTIKPW